MPTDTDSIPQTKVELPALNGENTTLRDILAKLKKKKEELSSDEQAYLAQEKKLWADNSGIVTRHAATFIKVGLALARIKDRELHKLSNIRGQSTSKEKS